MCHRRRYSFLRFRCLILDTVSSETPRYLNYYGQYVEYGLRTSTLVTYNGNSTLVAASSRPQRNAAMKAQARNNATGNVCLAKNDQGKIVRYPAPSSTLLTSQSNLS